MDAIIYRIQLLEKAVEALTQAIHDLQNWAYDDGNDPADVSTDNG